MLTVFSSLLLVLMSLQLKVVCTVSGNGFFVEITLYLLNEDVVPTALGGLCV